MKRATRVGSPAATQRINAVVFLRPSNPWLLKKVATRTSARAAYPASVLRRLFLPSAAEVAKVQSYLRSQGLTVTATHSFSINTTGSLAANQRAFGVSIGLYHGAHGRTFRAPSGAVKMPESVASVVQAVGGLDTALRLHSQAGGASRPSTAPTPTCSGPTNVQNQDPGAMLPENLASPGGYNIDNVGATGSGQTIGLVEFSNYKPADIAVAQSCFGLNPNVSDVAVNGGNTDLSGAAEVELDIQVAQETAPDAQVKVYVAPNDVTNTPAIIDQMVTDHVQIASDSWGLCEPVLPPSIVQAENTALEWAAVNGLSFYVASGDDGSSGCKQVTGSNALAVDDPSSQPFATSVGGTRLYAGGSQPQESAWKYGGGGVSQFWLKPTWQINHTLPVSWKSCAYPHRQCRETPDIALDANPDTGYIIYCTASRADCGGVTGWYVIGGTSGAAPLMAGITAVANDKAGVTLGFASPFLYSQTAANAGVFNDVTTGNNNIYGGSAYQAGSGYDMATGLGSVNAANLATALAGYSTPSPTPDSATLSVTSPDNGKRISYGQTVTFRGTLTDSTTSTPVADAPVWIQTTVGWGRAITNSSGQWAFTLRWALTRNMSWHAVYTGSDVLTPASTSSEHLYVEPHLSASVNLPRSPGHYDAKVGQRFTFSGVSSPNMHSARVIMQFRTGRSAWTSLASVGVGVHGKYSIRLRDSHRETILIRWEYKGATTYRWLSTVSKALVVKVS